MANSNGWKVGFFVLLTAILLILTAIGFYIFMQPKIQTLPTQPFASVRIIPSIQPIQSIQPSPQNSPTDFDLLKQAMAKKHNKEVSEVNLTVSKNTGQHAQGGVTFTGEMGGGWFLAAKTTDGWVIVDDGNGTISCQVIASYNFPVSIVPECWDEAAGKIIKR